MPTLTTAVSTNTQNPLVEQAEDAAAPATKVEPQYYQLPFSFAKRHGVLLSFVQQSYTLKCQAKTSSAILQEVRQFIGQSFTVQRVPEGSFDQLLTSSYQRQGNEAMQAAEDLGDEVDLSRIAEELPEIEDLMETEDDAPIIKLINALLTEAVRESASDIHIETFEDALVVRFRVDGVLREVLQPKRLLSPLLVSRLKVMAKLDIAEKRVPQDGRISLKIAGHAVDVRVSTMPSSHGERVVLRLLDKQAGRLDLKHLGMQAETRKHFDASLHMPHGIILVTGPTGSGKTTTLYAGLTQLNTHERNILTVEDPIEYILAGIGQTQVNSKVNMTFARGLRAMLRQDPDVVMVGEIRDLETAEIAVQASLTGHLVLSTLHTNTAIGAITRLQDMGIESFLLASSLVGVLAQRLVRLLCEECKVAHHPDPEELALLGEKVKESTTIYQAKGCGHCNHSGYRGRTGIYELVLIDEALRAMIHQHSGEQKMEKQARKTTPGIRQDGLWRILAGETTIEEVLRVTTEG